MRKTAAWNVMGVDRSTQAVAEEAARRAGMSLADWLDEVVAEQATEQGVAAEELTEDDRLDAIGERLDQLSRRERGAAPRVRRARDEVSAPEASASDDGIAEARLEAAIAKFDSRAARNEERTAKALESVAQWMERSDVERTRREAAKDGARDETRELDEQREPATRRPEPEGAKNLARSRLDLEEAVQRIQRRRGELDARQRVEPRASSREAPAPSPSVAGRPIPMPAQPAGPPRSEAAVEALREEISGLEARLQQLARERAARERPLSAAVQPAAPLDRRLTADETEALRGELAAMRRALGELAPRDANVALEGAVVDLGRRLEAMRKAAVSGESLRPLEDMLRHVMEMLRRQDPQAAAKGVENDLKALGGRLDALTRAAVDPAVIEQIRQQTEDLRRMFAKAAQSAPIAKLERQIEQLAERTEQLGSHPAPRPEIERLVAMFAETRTQIERAVSPGFLKTIEQRLESLSARIDDALARPAPSVDARPIEELARRFDTLKSVVERQADRPATSKVEAALADIGRKLDRPFPPATLDARPFEELARRVEGLRTAVEQQGAVAENPKLEAALAEIARKLDRPAPAPTLDARPFEELARRVEGLKTMVQRQAAIAENPKLEAALAEIGRKLDRPAPDVRPFDDLAKRMESLKAVVDRQASMPAATARLEATLAEIGKKLERVAAAPTLDGRPIDDLSRRFETLRAAVERQAETPAVNAKFEAALDEIGQKLDRVAAAPMIDTRPIADLSRRLDGLKTAFELQAASQPSTAKLETALAEIGQMLERVATAPTFDPRPIEDLSRRFDGLRTLLERQALTAHSTAKLEKGLAEIAKLLERMGASPTLDMRPIEDLSRRFDGLRTLLERQAATPPATAKLETELAEIGRRLERISAAPTFDARPIEELSRRFESFGTAFERQASAPPATAKLETELAEIGRRLERISAAPTFDARPIEELSRRLDGLKSAVERQASIPASTARLEVALAEMGKNLERVAAAPTLDPRPVEDLSRRFGSLESAVERQAASPPSTARLEAGLAEIDLKLERLSAAPALDMRPIEDLSRRLDSLKSAVERQGATAPANASIEAALADVGRKLDRPAPAPIFDVRPLEDLAQRMEGLRAAVELQAEGIAQGEKLGTAIADIGRKLDRPQQGLAEQMAIKSTLQALSTRVEDGFRKIGSAPPDSGRSAGALELELLDEIARRLEEMRGAIDRHGDFGASASRLEAAVADLANRMEGASEPASDRVALNETLRLLTSRLRDWDPTPAPVPADNPGLHDLAARIETLHASLEGHLKIAPQLSHLSAELAEIRQRLSAQGRSAEDARAALDLVQQLSDKIDHRDSSHAELRAMETLAREVLARPMRVDTSSIESMIGELASKLDATAGANFNLAPLVDWMAKIETRLEAVDPAPFTQAVRDLGDRIDSREPVALDARQIEETATLIAQRLEPQSGLGADAELLLRHLVEIHERLDGLGGAAGSSAALEKSVADLAVEFENTRHLLASIVEPAGLASGIVEDIADLKTEHASAEKRMSTRLTRVQEILEQLSDRLRLIEIGQNDRAGARDAPAAAQASPTPRGGYDFNDIPDRPRAAAGRLAKGAAAPPQAARVIADTAGLLLEPGAGAPRGRGKKPDEQPRAAETEDAPQSTDLQAHIAAARRAAMAEMNARREQAGAGAEAAAKRGGAPMAALDQARGVVANRRVPFLVGATLLVAAATAAVYELRGGHLPLIQKSELAPAVESPIAQAPAARDVPTVPAAAPKIDYAPTGAVDPAKSPDGAVKAPAAAVRAPSDLVAAIPAGAPDALKAAAAAGDPSAETEIGLRYVEGRGIARDPKIGARWLELAANQGVVYAGYRLGALYERGVGVAKDAPLARAWYKKASDGGNARAMHNLAVMNAEDGGNGKPDYIEAAAGFLAAGELGVHDSQYNLGVLYGRGLGVAQDLPQAWMWFSLAAQQGDVDASKKRDEIAAKMDAAQMAAAAKRLADFKPKTPLPAANEVPQPPGGWDAKTPAPQAAKPTPGASPTPATKS